jgi:hypothetical protein
MLKVKDCRGPCKKIKPLGDFALDRRNSSGRQSWCRDCTSARNKEIARNETQEQRDARNARRRTYNAQWSRGYRKRRPEIGRNSTLKYRHGIDLAAFNALLEKQGGACAICGRDDVVLHVDHDHECCPGRRSCGQCIRGLLCFHCNGLLGMAKDRLDLLEGAAMYLGQRLKDSME